MAGMQEIDISDGVLWTALSYLGYEPDGPREAWDKEMVESPATSIVALAIAVERDRCLRISRATCSPYAQRLISEGLEPPNRP